MRTGQSATGADAPPHHLPPLPPEPFPRLSEKEVTRCGGTSKPCSSSVALFFRSRVDAPFSMLEPFSMELGCSQLARRSPL